jgi:hypothetical protein
LGGAAQLLSLGGCERSNMKKAIIGIGAGLVLSGIAITGIYFLDRPKKYVALWIILSLLSWPILGWGAGHFAKYRGYTGAVGCSLTGLAFFIELFIVFRTHSPWVSALGVLFVASFPIAVILALPRKPTRSSRNRPKK